MHIHIFVESEEGVILIDRKYGVRDGVPPEIDVASIVDDANKYYEEYRKKSEEEVNLPDNF